MAEAVGDAQAAEGVGQQVTSSGAAQRFERVVAGEVTSLGDEVGGAHDAASRGTMTRSASVLTANSRRFTASRVPPSSS